ncbi:hypothetical protein J2Z76_000934 [Sedimentibacter acidaminivorans]|uniref:LiaF transmembrane domain-containing protein n=1 Tax=Sedimentibacter acidaminivorans TaxID=913099 RepID=A0ABS4GC29_9FIRM|nr:hypothetical protein [Sedimentibacter acidaminivorans]MBP1925077.1 hypothetical protein [Sedimentibacter acidaminivorans]
MKIKRVGTISMGIVLVAFGLILFVSQIKQSSALNMISTMWPIVLVLLGLEILWFRYSSKDENIAIKYDIFSIFIVFAILFVNIGIYAVTEVGVMSRLQNMVLSEDYNMDAVINEYIIDKNINKIIINEIDNLDIRATEDNKISGICKLNIYAISQEEAKKLSSEEYIKYKKSGNTLYIYAASNRNNNNSYSNPGSVEMFLPSNIDVEVTDCYNLDLVYSNFNNTWLFDRVNRINVRLDEISNVKINAFVESLDLLGGNIKWSFNSFGEYIKGEGANLIKILSSDNIIVNEV